MKAKVKSIPTKGSVQEYLDQLDNEQKRADSFAILEMMKKATGEEPVLWGQGLIGFGLVHIVSKSGREVDWFRIGFAPRKANLSLYLSNKLISDTETLTKLGKCKTGMGCLYINKLEDIDLSVLDELIKGSIRDDKGEFDS
jgi:hypothetical protein